eukprot:2246866-Prymnesium_polylepis.1
MGIGVPDLSIICGRVKCSEGNRASQAKDRGMSQRHSDGSYLLCFTCDTLATRWSVICFRFSMKFIDTAGLRALVPGATAVGTRRLATPDMSASASDRDSCMVAISSPTR